MQPNNPRQHGSWKILYTKDFVNFAILGILGTAIFAGLIIHKAQIANMRDELHDMKRSLGMNKESQQNQEINHGNETCLICNSTYEQ